MLYVLMIVLALVITHYLIKADNNNNAYKAQLQASRKQMAADAFQRSIEKVKFVQAAHYFGFADITLKNVISL